MLDYTIELISLAASNSLAVFCFCNLIIAILLIGSSSNSEEIKPINNNSFSNDENCKKITFSDQFEKANCNKNVVIETIEEKISSVSIDMVDFDEEEEEEEEEEEVNDDELKKRADEFIEKINRGWRAEKMQNHYSLGQ